MKTITYPLRLDQELYQAVEDEAKKRRMSLGDLFRQTIAYGLPALPPPPDFQNLLADTWDKLGPAPEIDYDKI